MSPRLCGSGVFADPNDLCLALTFATLCCGYRAATAGGAAGAVVWLAPVAVYLYAVVLTQSRGGLLGMLAAASAFLYARYGWKRALPLALVCLPAGVLALGGRQADLNVGKDDTAFERVMLWAEGLTLMGRSPVTLVTGIGAGEYAEEFGLVAHNSFIHAYVELGLLGGTAFLAAFVWAIKPVAADRPDRLEPWAARLRPFVLAMLAGYAAGAFSVSRNYVIPTYLILGVGSCYLALTPAADRPAVTQRWVARTALLGATGFVALRLITMFLGGMGG
jgi:O-antigen ligase